MRARLCGAGGCGCEGVRVWARGVREMWGRGHEDAGLRVRVGGVGSPGVGCSGQVRKEGVKGRC